MLSLTILVPQDNGPFHSSPSLTHAHTYIYSQQVPKVKQSQLQPLTLKVAQYIYVLLCLLYTILYALLYPN